MKLSLDVLNDKAAPASALVAIAINKYGIECFDWNPSLLRKELEEDYSVTIPGLSSDKLQGAITVLSGDSFEMQWEVFTTIIHLFNDVHDSFEDFIPLEAEYIAGALAEYYILNEGADDLTTFSPEVRAFAGEVFHRYGLCKAPDIFPTAIMPACVNPDADDSEKNEALSSIFNSKLDYKRNYLKNMQLCKA